MHANAPWHNVNKSTADHDLSDLAWSPSVGMGLQQGPFDWVPQQGRAELDPYNNTKRNIPNTMWIVCVCVPLCSCVSVICDMGSGSHGSDTRNCTTRSHLFCFFIHIFEIVFSSEAKKVKRKIIRTSAECRNPVQMAGRENVRYQKSTEVPGSATNDRRDL